MSLSTGGNSYAGNLSWMAPMLNTDDLADAREIADMLGLSHTNSVSLYQRRYPDMPRPVVKLGPGRPSLWLRPAVAAWRDARDVV